MEKAHSEVAPWGTARDVAGPCGPRGAAGDQRHIVLATAIPHQVFLRVEAAGRTGGVDKPNRTGQVDHLWPESCRGRGSAFTIATDAAAEFRNRQIAVRDGRMREQTILIRGRECAYGRRGIWVTGERDVAPSPSPQTARGRGHTVQSWIGATTNAGPA